MEILDMASFGDIGMFTLQEAFLSYMDQSSDTIFTGIKATQAGGSYQLLFHEKNSDVVNAILMDVVARLDDIGKWGDIPVH
jgi:hypothetical protein